MLQTSQPAAHEPQEQLEFYYISDLVAAFRVTARAIRHYEEKGLITPRRDRRTQERVYSRADRDRLSTILTAKKMGFTLREVGNLLEAADAELQIRLDVPAIDARISMLERQLQEISEALAQLRSMRAAIATEHH